MRDRPIRIVTLWSMSIFGHSIKACGCAIEKNLNRDLSRYQSRRLMMHCVPRDCSRKQTCALQKLRVVQQNDKCDLAYAFYISRARMSNLADDVLDTLLLP